MSADWSIKSNGISKNVYGINPKDRQVDIDVFPLFVCFLDPRRGASSFSAVKTTCFLRQDKDSDPRHVSPHGLISFLSTKRNKLNIKMGFIF